MPRRRRRSGRRNILSGPPAQSQIYRGPIRLPRSVAQADTTVIQMTYAQGQSANVSGVLAFSLSNIPNAFTSWASISAMWDEYRVIAMEVIWQPNYMPCVGVASGSTPFMQPNTVVVAWDRDSAGAPASLASVWDYASAQCHNICSKFTLKIKMTGSEDAGFTNVSSPVATWYYKFYSTGLTASVAYGNIFSRILVQFRGRV